MALEGFIKAAMLDPEWNDPQEEQRKLESYLKNTREYIEEKVNMGAENFIYIHVLWF